MKKYYFIGICGISMSALAIFLKHNGDYVSGSDTNVESQQKLLNNYDINVFESPNFEEIENCDVVVISSAIGEFDRELVLAKKLNKTIINRGQLLYEISTNYKNVIAIAGSHGKTTTTALIYNILKVAQKNPTLHLGGILQEENSNFVIGKSEYFVTEACEYKDNFLYLKPYISVITNIEAEHLDYFKTFENELKSFNIFEKNSKYVIKEDCSFKIKNLSHDKNGFVVFDIFYHDIFVMTLNTKRYEEVFAKDAIFAYRVCKKLGISDKYIKKGIEDFCGVKKRFEKIRCEKLYNAYIDYAHHPTEIENTIKTSKKAFKDKKIVVVFQPHTYSRTKLLFKDFIKSLSQADEVILFKTYPAREEKSKGYSEEELYLELKKKISSKHFVKVDELCTYLESQNSEERVFLFVGAGDLPETLNKINFIT